MPKKGPIAGSNKFRTERIEDGHKAKWHNYDDMTDEDLYADIDARRNLHDPTHEMAEDRTDTDTDGWEA